MRPSIHNEAGSGSSSKRIAEGIGHNQGIEGMGASARRFQADLEAPFHLEQRANATAAASNGHPGVSGPPSSVTVPLKRDDTAFSSLPEPDWSLHASSIYPKVAEIDDQTGLATTDEVGEEPTPTVASTTAGTATGTATATATMDQGKVLIVTMVDSRPPAKLYTASVRRHTPLTQTISVTPPYSSHILYNTLAGLSSSSPHFRYTQDHTNNTTTTKPTKPTTAQEDHYKALDLDASTKKKEEANMGCESYRSVDQAPPALGSPVRSPTTQRGIQRLFSTDEELVREKELVKSQELSPSPPATVQQNIPAEKPIKSNVNQNREDLDRQMKLAQTQEPSATKPGAVPTKNIPEHLLAKERKVLNNNEAPSPMLPTGSIVMAREQELAQSQTVPPQKLESSPRPSSYNPGLSMPLSQEEEDPANTNMNQEATAHTGIPATSSTSINQETSPTAHTGIPATGSPRRDSRPGAHSQPGPDYQAFHAQSSGSLTFGSDNGSTNNSTPDSPGNVVDDGLPNASPVPNDLQDAQEVDLDAVSERKSLHTRHHSPNLLFIGMAFFALLVLVLVLAVMAVQNSKEPTTQETTMPSSRHSKLDKEAIISLISETLDVSYTTLQSTTWNRAMEWILEEDGLRLGPLDSNLAQRFWLAYLYYSTTDGQLWSSCNPVNATTSATDNLCYYRQITGDGLFGKVSGIAEYTHWRTMDHELLASRWLSELHECQWAGLFCNDNHTVETLQLDFMNLTGTVPDGLHVLSDLQAISMTYNNLWGTLPDDLASLKNLTFLDFQHNDFSGTVPYSWWSSKDMKENIRTINLSFNPLSAWSLPNEIGRMSKLKHLQLDDSGITGSIPGELYQLTQLEFFDAETNQITGTLATEIGLLSNLLFLAVSNTFLTGTMPSEVAHMTNLTELDLKHTNIGGSIPEELYFGNFQQLSALILDDCQFSGTISTNIGRLSNLGFIFLSGNTGLSGTIPTQIGLLSDLRRFIVHWTGLSGTVPSEVCDLRGASALQYLKTDCQELSDGTTPVECATGCCTKCCSKETQACTKMFASDSED